MLFILLILFLLEFIDLLIYKIENRNVVKLKITDREYWIKNKYHITELRVAMYTILKLESNPTLKKYAFYFVLKGHVNRVLTFSKYLDIPFSLENGLLVLSKEEYIKGSFRNEFGNVDELVLEFQKIQIRYLQTYLDSQEYEMLNKPHLKTKPEIPIISPTIMDKIGNKISLLRKYISKQSTLTTYIIPLITGIIGLILFMRVMWFLISG